jgi:hypothetical protein
MAEHGDGNIKVVVRCRPLNSRGKYSRVYLMYCMGSNGV